MDEEGDICPSSHGLQAPKSRPTLLPHALAFPSRTWFEGFGLLRTETAKDSSSQGLLAGCGGRSSRSRGGQEGLSRPVVLGLRVAAASASQGILRSAPFPSLCSPSSWTQLHVCTPFGLSLCSHSQDPMSSLGEDVIGPAPFCSGCCLCT